MPPRSLVSGIALLASATLWLGWMLACGKKQTQPAPAAQPAQPAATQPSPASTQVVVDSLTAYMEGRMDLATLNVIVDQNMAPAEAGIIKQQAATCSAQPPGQARIQCFDSLNQAATNTAQPATTNTTSTSNSSTTSNSNGADWGAHAQPKQD